MVNQKSKALDAEEQRKAQANNEMWLKRIALAVIIAVAGYAEVNFLIVVDRIFPDNLFLQSAGTIGAVMTGVSCVVLVLAKMHWIRAGSQSKISWSFLVVEIIIMFLNIILAYQMSTGGVKDWMMWYSYVCPASPLFAFLGWILVIMTDQEKELMDRRRRAHDAILQAEADHELEVQEVVLELNRDILHIQADHMRKEVEARRPEIERAASLLVSQQISAMVGTYVSPTGNKTVQSSGQALPLESGKQKAVSLAQTASAPAGLPTRPDGLLNGVKNAWRNAFTAGNDEDDNVRGSGKKPPILPDIAIGPVPASTSRPARTATPQQRRDAREARLRRGSQPANPTAALSNPNSNGQSRKKTLPTRGQ